MVHQETALMAVSAYRQVLRNFRSSSGTATTEESAAALKQAKQRVMLRLKAVRAKRALRDPRHAFQRLYDNLSVLRAAKDSARRNLLSGLTAERGTSSLRSVYGSFKERGLRAMSNTGLSTATPSGDPSQHRCEGISAAAHEQALREAAVTGQDGIMRNIVLAVVASASKLFMNAFSTLNIENSAVLQAALERPAGQPLITVSNHVAAMDDPLLLAALTPLASAVKPGAMRWSLCASDRCFQNSFMSAFFRAGQVLPVERGKGMQQPGMKAAESRLAAGEWVHIFPEGTRSSDGITMGAIRAGIGRLIASCQDSDPLVIPIIHDGMQHIMPRGCKLPVPGQTIRAVIGEPIAVADIILTAQQNDWTELRLDRALAARVAESMVALKAQVDGVQLQEARLQEEVPLALLEDELDAAGHPWNSPTIGRFVDTVGVGRGALCFTPAAQCSSCSSPVAMAPGAAAFSPTDMILQSQNPLRQQQHSQQRLLSDVLRSSTWDVVRGIERALVAVGRESRGYSDLRSSLMMAMLQPRTPSL